MTAEELWACRRQLTDALARLQRSAKDHPSRELSIAITHVETGLLWLDKVPMEV